MARGRSSTNKGTLVNYHRALKICAQDDTRNDFIQFLRLLGEENYTGIHILSHSMGARVVTNALVDFDSVFQTSTIRTSHSTLNSVSNLPKLSSITFMNPETPLYAFRDVHYDQIKRFTDLVTIYGSNNDIALLASQHVFSRQQILGCHVYDLVSSDIESNATLDLDVIDTTQLDINVHLARHMYFNLNKFVIDDVIDLISTCKRAAAREHRLTNLGGNVYGFLAAPSYIVKL